MELEEDTPENQLVRVVNSAVHRLDDAIFDAAYPGGGRDSYHPKMLTKVIIYAYTQRMKEVLQTDLLLGQPPWKLNA